MKSFRSIPYFAFFIFLSLQPISLMAASPVDSSGRLTESLVVRSKLSDTQTPWVVGDDGSQTLTVTDSAQVNLSSLTLGNTVNGVGELVMKTNRNDLVIHDSLIVAVDGNGVLTNQGGTIAAASIIFAQHAGSNATLRMSGGNLLASEISKGAGDLSIIWTGGTIMADKIDFDLSTQGGVLQVNPSTMTLDQNLTIGYGGTLLINAVSPVLPANERIQGSNSTLFKDQSNTSPDFREFSVSDDPFLNISDQFLVFGTLKVTIPDHYKPQAGDMINLFKARRILGRFKAMNLPELEPELRWDTSHLYSDGTLKVATAFEGLINDRPLNYPNPFNRASGTFIGYYLSRNNDMELRVYTWTGKEVFRHTMDAGTEGGHVGYNKVPLQAGDLGDPGVSGIFVYLLISDNSVVGKGKMVILP